MPPTRIGYRVLICIVTLPAVVQAAQLTVAPGQSVGDSLRHLRPGDTLVLRAGQHRGSLTIEQLTGTAAAPITIRGEPGAVIVPSERDGILFYPQPSAHVVVEGLKIEHAARAGIIISHGEHITIRNCQLGNHGVWGVQTTMSDYITVENCELYGSQREHGVYFSTTDHPVARGNRIHDNGGCGIHNNGDRREGGDGMITGGLYEQNVIYNNGRRGGAAINLDGVEQSVIRNNLLYNNLAGGIVSFHGDGARGGAQNEFDHNTIYFAPSAGRFGIKLSEGEACVVTNNIIVCGRGPALDLDPAALRGLRSDRNVLLRLQSAQPLEYNGRPFGLREWQQMTRQDQHSLSVDPAFVDPARGDFMLRPGSPAVGCGVPGR